MAEDTDRSKKQDTNVKQDGQPALEYAMHQMLTEFERSELKDGLAAMKSGLAAWHKKAQSGSQSAMLVSVLEQYIDQMEKDGAKQDEPVMPEQDQGQTAPPQTDGGSTLRRRLRPGLMVILPDLCLLAVFRKLPPKDQLTTQRVCRRFAVLGQEVMRNRRSLTLLFGRGELHQIRHLLAWEADLQLEPDERALFKLVRNDDGSPQFPTRPVTKWNSLRYDSPTEAIVLEIGSTFSGITKLQVGLWEDKRGRTQMDVTAFTSLARLLEQLPQLVTFRFFEYIRFYMEKKTRQRPNVVFYRTLNSLRHLKHLTLRLDTAHFDELTSTFIAQLDVLIFGYLDASYLKCFKFLRQCQELNDLGQGNDQQHFPAIYFDYMSSDMNLEDLSRLSDPFRRQLKQLQFYYTYFVDEDYLHRLRRHCALFPSLVNLALRNLSWRDILDASVQLPQLVNLKLISSWSIRGGLGPLPQLPSLKVLQLIDLTLNSHNELEAMHLGWTVPNLQVLKIELMEFTCRECRVKLFRYKKRCDQCGHFFDDRHPVKGQLQDCYRQFLDGLKRDCRQLHTIRIYFRGKLVTVEQLSSKG